MQLQTEWVRYSSGTSVVPAYTARPLAATGPLPAIILIQEIWGVDDHIMDLAHRFATAGYLVAAPDLYAHGGTRPEALEASRIATAKRTLDGATPAVWSDPSAREAAINALPESERSTTRDALALLLTPNRPLPQYAADLCALSGYLRAQPGCTGRVGSVGYCMGGGLSALLAARDPDLDAAAIYYGSAPSAGDIPQIRCPLAGFYGGEDVRITGGVPALEQALRSAGKTFEAHIYPGAPHAFFNDTRPSYHVDAARDAWARTLTFFNQHLASQHLAAGA
ncbi:MAG TPA: dienelactone hydrolase family protein [Gemmatimonadaceae bacterium]|nr:dienelactone hydrolase family protein [Gemmatimonadaceae bacterium]